MAKKPTRTKSSKPKVTITTIRENRGKDLSPSWEGHETWTKEQFSKNYHNAMQFYNLGIAAKETKAVVIKWMNANECDQDIIAKLKKVKDWQLPSTMSSIASCLMRGMPTTREDFNCGRNASEWLFNRILQVINDATTTQPDEDDDNVVTKPVVSVQDRTYDISLTMCDEIEGAIDGFIINPDKFNPKALDILALLKSKQAKAAHTKFINDHYSKEISVLESVLVNTDDEELKENYSRYSKKHIKKLIDFYREVEAACGMIKDEAKATRKVRVKKPIAKEKLVEKLKYKKTDDKLKLVSVNPVTIIGSKELYCYDTKTRKIYKYVSNDLDDLTVKGSMIVGFDENKSIGKTLRKPEEQLTQFKNAGKVALRTFMDSIRTIDIKATGRITEHQILLKVQ